MPGLESEVVGRPVAGAALGATKRSISRFVGGLRGLVELSSGTQPYLAGQACATRSLISRSTA